jgi:hypothetical protein
MMTWRNDVCGRSMARGKRAATRGLALVSTLALSIIGLSGCYYVVPAPPPPPGGALVVPQLVRERPQCGWKYGTGWYGWAWYGSVPC